MDIPAALIRSLGCGNGSKNTGLGLRSGISNERDRRLCVEPLECRHLLAVIWRNPVDAFDIDNDGFVVPSDALVIINDLNAFDSRLLPATHPPGDAVSGQHRRPKRGTRRRAHGHQRHQFAARHAGQALLTESSQLASFGGCRRHLGPVRRVPRVIEARIAAGFRHQRHAVGSRRHAGRLSARSPAAQPDAARSGNRRHGSVHVVGRRSRFRAGPRPLGRLDSHHRPHVNLCSRYGPAPFSASAKRCRRRHVHPNHPADQHDRCRRQRLAAVCARAPSPQAGGSFDTSLLPAAPTSRR